MLTTVERLGVDAAIIFSDLLLILEPMGLDLAFTAGEGPQFGNPIRSPADVDRLVELESVEPLEFVDGDGPADPRRAARVAAADRLRRGAVHPGRLRRRGRIEPRLSLHKDADVQRRRGLGRDDEPAGPGDRLAT